VILCSHQECPDCKRCAKNRYAAEYYKANAEKVKTRTAEYHRRTRKQVVDHYGGRCACCGEEEYAFLCIDHVNDNGAQHRRQINAARGKPNKKNMNGSANIRLWRWIIRNGYPSDFQILCWNCNSAKHFYGVCPHHQEVPENGR